jgi:hypothetical protein
MNQGEMRQLIEKQQMFEEATARRFEVIEEKLDQVIFNTEKLNHV